MFKKNLKVASVAVGSVAALAGNAAAAIPAEFTALPTTDVDSIMGFVIVALATLWGYRKVVKTMNRS
jgi:hypothetical protein